MQGRDLDRTIRLERATVTQDPGSGENIETWVTLGPEKLFANYKPVSDGEKISAGELAATLSARFTVSYDSSISDVNAKDRLVFEGRTFDIFGAKEAGERRRRFIEITASARAD